MVGIQKMSLNKSVILFLGWLEWDTFTVEGQLPDGTSDST